MKAICTKLELSFIVNLVLVLGQPLYKLIRFKRAIQNNVLYEKIQSLPLSQANSTIGQSRLRKQGGDAGDLVVLVEFWWAI